jgi:pimeloyl-ACP methyl ester carboxylesterase
MGNSLQRQVYPGRPNPLAEDVLKKEGYDVHDICVFAPERRSLSGEFRRVFVFFHGNAEEASEAVRSIPKFAPTQSLMFEYPGYGWRFREVCTEKALLADIPRQLAWIDTLVNHTTSGKVVLCGRSLGSFAALNLALELGPSKCRGIILLSPLLSAIATRVPPPFHRALALLDLANNELLAQRLSPEIPVCIAHGTLDALVPIANADALWNALPKPCRRLFMRIPGRDHHNLGASTELWDGVDSFIKTLE